jgi:4-pyridoxolactonase
MKVSMLPSGSMLIDHSQLFWNHDPGQSIRHPVYSVLIEHPAGRVLIDTGFDMDHVRAVLPFVEPRHDIGGPVSDGLAALGLGFGDVDYVIHTHLHFDHVGGNPLLSGATVFVHKAEMRQARVPEPFEMLSYSDQRFAGPGVAVEFIEGDTEVLPGITMLETPGHSAGHCSVLLSGDGGRELLFCGDAAYTRANLDRTVISGFHVDPVAGVRSLRRLQQLERRDGIELFFPHDRDEFARYPLSPDSIEL